MSTVETSDTETTRAVVERFYAAILSGDWDGVRECIADDIELHQPPSLPYGKVYRGPDETMPLWQNVIMPLARPGTAVPETFVAEGDTFVGIAKATTDKGGKEMIACEEYKVRDGRIWRIRMFWYDPTPVAEEALANGITAPL